MPDRKAKILRFIMHTLVVFGLLLVAAFNTGCAKKEDTKPPTTIEVTKYVYYECGKPPELDALELQEVLWRVLRSPEGLQVIALDAENYEKLSRNDAAILSRAQQLAAQRDFYAQCIERSKLIQPKVATPEP